jgi:hypothetical protein
MESVEDLVRKLNVAATAYGRTGQRYSRPIDMRAAEEREPAFIIREMEAFDKAAVEFYAIQAALHEALYPSSRNTRRK